MRDIFAILLAGAVAVHAAITAPKVSGKWVARLLGDLDQYRAEIGDPSSLMVLSGDEGVAFVVQYAFPSARISRLSPISTNGVPPGTPLLVASPTPMAIQRLLGEGFELKQVRPSSALLVMRRSDP